MVWNRTINDIDNWLIDWMNNWMINWLIDWLESVLHEHEAGGWSHSRLRLKQVKFHENWKNLRSPIPFLRRAKWSAISWNIFEIAFRGEICKNKKNKIYIYIYIYIYYVQSLIQSITWCYALILCTFKVSNICPATFFSFFLFFTISDIKICIMKTVYNG